MFERFTSATRQVVLDAVGEAEREQAARVRPDHLLLALSNDTARSAPILRSAGLTREVMVSDLAAAHRRGGLTEADAAALGELGIDVDAIVERIEQSHGENALATGLRRRSRFPMGHIPFTAEAKRVLVDALRQAKERHERHIGDEHLLLAMATGSGVVAQVLADHDLSYAQVRTHLVQAS